MQFPIGAVVVAAACALVSAAEPSLTAGAPPEPALKLLAEGFAAPTVLASLPDGSGRLLVADQAGVVYLLNHEGGDKSVFLDLRERMVALNPGMEERGLTGLAVRPDFKTTRKIYVVYSAPLEASGPKDWNNTMRVSEFRVPEGGEPAAQPGSERIVLQIDKPDWNHNSGRIAFGPDGDLYVTVGDGGAPNDVGRLGHAPEGNGQHLQTLLGKILRIDVDHGNPYAIPGDNPYADGVKGRKEIYAYGIRNPWGISFDRGGRHELIVTDVGQERWEEINLIVNGGNYGWRLREGFDGFDPDHPNTPPENPAKVGADGKPFVGPVFVYRTFRPGLPKDQQSFGTAITGGYIYRGKLFPQLAGKYVFGDWSRGMAIGNGTLLVATRPPEGTQPERWTAEPLAVKDHADGRLKGYLWALGEDEDGELYVMTNGANMARGERGKLYRLVAAE